MAKRKEGRVLPAPATQVDIYLNAIVEELERLNDNIAELAAQPAQATGDNVALREAAAETVQTKAKHRDVKGS